MTPPSGQLPALQDLRAQLQRVAEAESRRSLRRRPPRAVLALAAVLLLGVPAGFAIAQVTGGDEVASSDCPAANAAVREAGLPIPDQYGPGCPSREQIQRYIDLNQRSSPAPPPILRQAEKEGRIQEDQDPATYPPDVKRAIEQWRADHPGEG